MTEETETGMLATDLVAGHTVSGFDRELQRLRSIVLEMGQRVAEQCEHAAAALIDGELHQAYRVLDREPQVDFLSVDADEEIFRVIAKRQPTAVDLRIVLGLSRIAGEIERAGDKAARIAGQALALHEPAGAVGLMGDEFGVALRALDRGARRMFERCLKAVAGFDVGEALQILESESELAATSKAVFDQLAHHEEGGLEPRQVLRLYTGAHAMDRIGHHASSIAEQVIYVAEGQDIRYRNREILIATLRGSAFSTK